jgi:hypothetical protein
VNADRPWQCASADTLAELCVPIRVKVKELTGTIGLAGGPQHSVAIGR